MTTNKVVVEGYGDLLALHKGLMEARFADVPNNFYVSGSPTLARLHERVVAALEDIETEAGSDPAKWSRWLVMSDQRREWNLALNNARNDSSWSHLSDAEKLDRAKDYLAPFSVSSDLLERFVSLANSM